MNSLDNYIKIKWSELKIGDQFENGSIVVDISPWTYETCYILKCNGIELIVSENHLISALLINDSGEICNNILLRTNTIKDKVGVKEGYWMSAWDMYLFRDLDQYEIKILNCDEVYDLESIERFKNGEKQKVRCITTSNGVYNIGPFVSHNTGGKNLKQSQERDIINKTFDAFSSSPIIQKTKEAKTTEECRRIIYEGLKEEYAKNGIAMDDYNIMIIAKKMTSFKRDKDGMRYVRDGEKCDIASIGSIGNFDNPFKKAELGPSYKFLTRTGKYKLKPDAANEIIF